MENPRIVIVGAGPAGMMLAYQLVTNGVPVTVLERHKDFEREFRGELIQPAVLQALEQIGLLEPLAARKVARTGVERRMFVGETRQVQVPGGKERGALISQAEFLAFLHELCAKHPHYKLETGTTALEAIRDGERVVAMKTRRDGAEGRVDGDLFVVTAGRNSALRKGVVPEVESHQVPADVLWLRFDFSDCPEILPEGVDVHLFGRGVVTVVFGTTRNRLQVAYSAPGDLSALKKDLPALKKKLLPTLTKRLRGAVEKKLDESTETQVLRVVVDRLATWHAPGILFLGDAAHTMSPAGGVGLNLALRDAFSSANHVLAAIKGGKAIDAPVLAAIEAERRPEVEELQERQKRIHRGVMAPIFVQHLMFTMLGFVSRRLEKGGRGPKGLAPMGMKYGVPVAK